VSVALQSAEDVQSARVAQHDDLISSLNDVETLRIGALEDLLKYPVLLDPEHRPPHDPTVGSLICTEHAIYR